MGRAKTLISPEEYLSMSFGERDPEYVRGELIYKPMPDGIHGHLQGLLIVLLSGALRCLGYRITPETRSQLEADNFRLPDIAVFGPDQPFQVVPTEPPVIAVEIISKDERYSEILQKLEDYRSWACDTSGRSTVAVGACRCLRNRATRMWTGLNYPEHHSGSIWTSCCGICRLTH